MSTGRQPSGPPPPVAGFRETNGLAIGSLITGVIAIVPVAIVLGIVALVQIKRRGDRGRGLAIAGICIACGWVVAVVVAIALLAANEVERDVFGRVTEAGYLNEIELLPGDCLNDPKEDAILLRVVPCDEPHNTEVFARFKLKGDGYPGGGSVRRRATAGCRHRLEDLLPKGYGPPVSKPTYFSPDRLDWAIGDHDVTCFFKHGSNRAEPVDSLFTRARRQTTGPVLY